MSAEEFSHWIAFQKLEPFGDARADMRSGVVASILRNAHKARDDSRVYTPDDFVLFKDEPEAQADLSPADMRRRFMQIIPAKTIH